MVVCVEAQAGFPELKFFPQDRARVASLGEPLRASALNDYARRYADRLAEFYHQVNVIGLMLRSRASYEAQAGQPEGGAKVVVISAFERAVSTQSPDEAFINHMLEIETALNKVEAKARDVLKRGNTEPMPPLWTKKWPEIGLRDHDQAQRLRLLEALQFFLSVVEPFYSNRFSICRRDEVTPAFERIKHIEVGLASKIEERQPETPALVR